MTKKDINPNTYTVKNTVSILKKLQDSDCQNINSEITILAFKEEQLLEIWLTSDTCQRLISAFPIQLSSTISGPKLYDSETRLPEGIYRFELRQDSILINYPNEYDRIKAAADNRTLMNDKVVFQSVMNKNAIILPSNILNELRVFLENMDLEKTKLVIIPSDIRDGETFSNCSNCPHWVYELYGQLKLTLNTFSK